LGFLKVYHPELPISQSDDLFIDDEKIEDELSKIYSFNSTLNDRNQQTIIGASFRKDVKFEKIQHARLALRKIKEIDQELYCLFNTAIHSIFLRDSDLAAGGSSSSGIGVIWLNNKPHLNQWDLIELFIHELTHNLLFLDELRYLHYRYNLVSDKENYAVSSILKAKRPLDKVIHSIVVSTEILLFRQTKSGSKSLSTIHPSTEILRQNTLQSIDSVLALKNLKSLVRDRVMKILADCRTVVVSDCNAVAS
jgi:ATP-dependent exoDNAse (exonuclease V) alpha subunit